MRLPRDYNGDIEWPMVFILGFFGSLLLLIGGTVGIGIVDSVQDFRAFDARMACEAKRMEPRRRELSTKVVCVPINTRQDTTTVQVR